MKFNMLVRKTMLIRIIDQALIIHANVVTFATQRQLYL